MSITNYENPFKDCVLLQVKRSWWSAEITAKMRSGVDANIRKALQERFKIKKVLIDHSNKAYKAPITLMNQFYIYLVGAQYMPGVCMPFAIDGSYLLPIASADEVWKEYEKTKVELETTVKALGEAYPAIIQEAQIKFNDLNTQLFTDENIKKYFQTEFNQSEYPSTDELVEKFDMRLRMIKIDVPDNLSSELLQKQAAELKTLFEEAKEKIVLTLLAKFKVCIENLRERCESGDKISSAKNATFENPKKFCEIVQGHLNVCDNTELRALVDECSKYLSGVKNVQQLKEDEGARTTIAINMDKISKTIDELIIKNKGRVFSL